MEEKPSGTPRRAAPLPATPAAPDHTRTRRPAAAAAATARDAEAFGLPVHPTCPFCRGEDTELHSPFGPQLSVASYWCNACRTPFELLKWRTPG